MRLRKRIYGILVIWVLVLAGLASGCVSNPAPDNTLQTVSAGLASLHNALELAQVGYADYATIAGKTTNPKVQAGMQIIDSQLDILGKLAYNIASPRQADIDQANAALTAVTQAKQTISAVN